MAYLEIFLFRLVLRLRGIIVAPPIMVQQKIFSPKSYFLCITNIEIVQNSKSKPKNSHSCVPLSSLYLSYHVYTVYACVHSTVQNPSSERSSHLHTSYFLQCSFYVCSKQTLCHFYCGSSVCSHFSKRFTLCFVLRYSYCTTARLK